MVVKLMGTVSRSLEPYLDTTPIGEAFAHYGA